MGSADGAEDLQCAFMNRVHFSSKDHCATTPPEFFEALNNLLKFTLDPCCLEETALCKKFYTPEDNGLIQDWTGERVFMNPPYGQELKHWIAKAYYSEAFTVALIPSRTDTKWFHSFIYGKHRIDFIRGRLKFGGLKHNAPFPSMLVFFNEDLK